jgi:hypothetical protein
MDFCTFAPEVVCFLLDINGIADLHFDLVVMSGYELVEPSMRRLQQL